MSREVRKQNLINKFEALKVERMTYQSSLRLIDQQIDVYWSANKKSVKNLKKYLVLKNERERIANIYSTYHEEIEQIQPLFDSLASAQ
jgi:hypothetical protein